MRVLSKSRFKLGLECPNKLFYTGKAEYVNSKVDDPFLQALANGGYQVEELAKLHYPNGECILADMRDYEAQAEQTRVLLERDEVIIYEAAFLFDGLFVRTDILVKKGNHIKIVEIKAKSYQEGKTKFIGSKPNELDYKMSPYLVDLTFQWHVVSMCYPNQQVDACFMMVDKSKTATINGMNQLFRINRKEGEIVRESKISSLAEVGDSVLCELRMTDLVLQIKNGHFECSKGKYFMSEVTQLKSTYLEDKFFGSLMAYSKCKKCEFKKSKPKDSGKSGIEECYTHHFNKPGNDVYKPNVLDVWHFNRNGDMLIEENKFLLKEIDKNHFTITSDRKPGLSRTERQWEQISRTLNRQTVKPYFAHYELERAMAEWKFPLHFIDFETSAPALPFTEGMKSYENVAFQFSHHIMHEDGRIEHAGEFICDEPGVFPNFIFAKFLMAELSHDEGTIFRYSSHENTVLNQIIQQLQNSDFESKQELLTFLLSITEEKENSKIIRQGNRSMVDLCHIVQRYYYHPFMKGSNSLKYVLPAILNSSEYLKTKYSKPIGEINVTSKNFSSQHRWIDDRNDVNIDPYKSLPPVYPGKSVTELDEYFGDLNEIGNGGAAMTAYGLLQYTDMTKQQREQLIHSLLKYCELDTLAMVMLMDFFRNEVKTRSLFYGPKPDKPTTHILYYPRNTTRMNLYSRIVTVCLETQEKLDRYISLHNKLLEILKIEVPHIAWKNFKHPNSRRALKPLMYNQYGERLRRGNLLFIYDNFGGAEKYEWIEDSSLKEIVNDFRWYRENSSLHPTERLVLLLDLVDSEISDKDYIITENNGLILNTSRLSISQMVELIKQEKT
jgi:hypothetical protein